MHPTSFDASVWEIWTPLAIGAQLHLPPDIGRDPVLIAEFLGRKKITIAQFVPALLQSLLQVVLQDERPKIAFMFCGGEALSSQLAMQALSLSTEQIS